MTENTKNSLSIDEIIDFFEKNYNDEQQREIVQILFRLEHTINSSPLLENLINKKVIQISQKPNIQYCLEKYFEEKNIEKISERKNFIISNTPNLKGLKRGKSASYEDLIDFISKNYFDEFKRILSDIKVYSFTDPFKENGRTAFLYLNRKHNPKANYKFNSRTGQYELKEDTVTEILRSRNINFDASKIEINAAFYGRCTSLSNVSIIENQRSECYALAKSQNTTITKEYIDSAASGQTDQRPQFQQLMEDVKKGLYDVVYIYSADRFSRNMPDFIKYQNELKEAGCKLVSVRGDIPSDFETSLMSVPISKTLENAHRRLPIWKIILLVVLWPIGLYVLYKKIKENR